MNQKEAPAFYASVEKALKKAREAFQGYRVIAGGDWNGRVGMGGGRYDPTFKGVLGPFVQIPERNVSGEAMLQLCYDANLVVANSLVMPPTGDNPLAVDVDRKHLGTFYFANQGKGCFDHYLDHFLTTPSLVHDGTIQECYVSQLLLTMDDSDHRPLMIILKGTVGKKGQVNNTTGADKAKEKALPPHDYTAMMDDKLNERVGRLMEAKMGAAKGTEGLTYDNFVELAREVADEILPFKRVSSQEIQSWFEGPMKGELVRLVASKQNAWVKHKMDGKNRRLRIAYDLANKKVKEATAEAKSRFWERLAEEQQEAFNSSPARYFEVIHRQTGNVKAPVFDGKGLLNSDGSIAEDAVARMKEHFQTLFNPEETPEEGEARRQVAREMLSKLRYQYPAGDVNILLGPILMEEMEEALKKVKNTALGADRVSAAFLKGDHMNGTRVELLGLMQQMLVEGTVPESMKIAWLVPLHKGKGLSKEDMDSYRAIALLPGFGKLFERILVSRLERFVERMGVVPESQCAFKKGSGVDDAQWLDRIVTAGCMDRNLPLYKLYVDMKKAYDKVDRVLLADILRKIGVPDHFIGVLMSFLQGASAAIKVNGEISEPFPLLVGLRQGSPASPFLFNIFLGMIMRITHEKCDDLATARKLQPFGIPMAVAAGGPFLDYGTSVKRLGTQFFVRDVCFADDMALPSLSNEALQLTLDVLDMVTQAFGQEISHEKTEVMVTVKQPAAATAEDQLLRANLHLVRNVLMKRADGSEGIEEVRIPIKECFVFKYLGSRSNSRNNTQDEVDARVSSMCIAWSKLKQHVFLQKKLEFKAKWVVYVACVLAAGMYGAAVSMYADKELTRLDSKHFSFVRQMLGVSWTASKEEVIAKAALLGIGVTPIRLLIRQRQLSKAGHILRSKHEGKEEALTRQVMTAQVNINQVGGPKWITSTGNMASKPPQPTGLKPQIQRAFVEFGGGSKGTFEQVAAVKLEWQRFWRVDGLRFAMRQWLIARDLERRKRADGRAGKAEAHLRALARIALAEEDFTTKAVAEKVCGGCSTAMVGGIIYCPWCRNRFCLACWRVEKRHRCEQFRVTLPADQVGPPAAPAEEVKSRRKRSAGGKQRAEQRRKRDEEAFDWLYEEGFVEIPPAPVCPRRPCVQVDVGVRGGADYTHYDLGGCHRTATVEVEEEESDMDSEGEAEERDDDADSVEDLVQESHSGKHHADFPPRLARPGVELGAGARYVPYPGVEVYPLWLSIQVEKWGDGSKLKSKGEKRLLEACARDEASHKKRKGDALEVVDRGPHAFPGLRRYVTQWNQGEEEAPTRKSRKDRRKERLSNTRVVAPGEYAGRGCSARNWRKRVKRTEKFLRSTGQL